MARDRQFVVDRAPEDAAPQRVASFGSAAAGHAALQKGDLYGAEDLLERAVALDPGNPFSYFYLAEVRYRQGEAKQALVLLDQSELRFHGHPYWLGEVYALKALCWEKLGSAEKSKAAYEKALEYNPSNRETR
ncbi:MAG: tetratricopeptide repeat protein [bacterium]